MMSREKYNVTEVKNLDQLVALELPPIKQVNSI